MPPRRACRLAISLAMAAFATGLAVASELVDFARCLARAGATYYTAEWCPHCARQDAMFGNARRYLRVVDCTDGCDGVASFPTWTFADGSRISGVATLEALGRRTRCRLGEPSRGIEIIEVPRR